MSVPLLAVSHILSRVFNLAPANREFVTSAISMNGADIVNLDQRDEMLTQ